MSDSWCWLSSETKLRLWPEPLLAVSPCGLGFLTTWPSQGTRCLPGVSGLPRWVSQENQAEMILPFITKPWHSHGKASTMVRSPPRLGGVSKSHHRKNTWSGYVVVAIYPVPPWLYLSVEHVSLTPSHGPWLLTLFSQALCSPFIHHKAPWPFQSKTLKWNYPPVLLEEDDPGVLFGLFPLNIPRVSENCSIFHSRAPKNSEFHFTLKAHFKAKPQHGDYEVSSMENYGAEVLEIRLCVNLCF